MHFKSLDSGRLSGLVTSIVYRNPQFVQQWMFNTVGMAAEGRTAASLVDECQVRPIWPRFNYHAAPCSNAPADNCCLLLPGNSCGIEKTRMEGVLNRNIHARRDIQRWLLRYLVSIIVP